MIDNDGDLEPKAKTDAQEGLVADPFAGRAGDVEGQGQTGADHRDCRANNHDGEVDAGSSDENTR